MTKSHGWVLYDTNRKVYVDVKLNERRLLRETIPFATRSFARFRKLPEDRVLKVSCDAFGWPVKVIGRG